VRTAIDRFGTVDIIINNAGTFGGNLAFHATKLEDFRRLIGVHLFGTAALTHAAWPVMMEKRYGRVIMTASSAGLWGIENVSSYCAAKGGIIGLAKSLAHEGKDQTVSCFACLRVLRIKKELHLTIRARHSLSRNSAGECPSVRT
jgi:NAD(P)-dependent dehydrogenase (short-subunit alcohol dehydrogenase family)